MDLRKRADNGPVRKWEREEVMSSFFANAGRGLKARARRKAIAEWFMEVSVLTGVFPILDYILREEQGRQVVWWVPWAGVGICLLFGIGGLYLLPED